jgi:NAD-dependent dihydropyrimidine dehydrogenase PreA subunit
MLDRILNRAELCERIDAIGRQRRLIGPVRRSLAERTPPQRCFYETVSSASQLDLDFSYCVYSPKSVLLPPRETLFRYQKENGGFAATAMFDHRPAALVGVHPCDIHAIELLDRVFGADPADEHYLARRRSLFIVGVDCPRPCADGVFCHDMQTNEARRGFDVMLYPLRDRGGPAHHAAEAAAEAPRYGVVYGSDAGREWITGACGRSPEPEDEAAMVRYVDEKREAFHESLRTPPEHLPALLARSYDSLVWDATARRCYSCGSCNLVCPTCYCFDVQDVPDLDGRCGTREREWDACQLRDFALVAGGHNFRPKAGARLRHRVNRKLRWIRDRSGLPGCTGCGRCDRACTARISIVKIVNQLAEEEA